MIDEKQRIYLRLRLHIRCSNTVFDQGEAVHRDPRGELENSKHFGRKLSALQGSDIVVYKNIRSFGNHGAVGEISSDLYGLSGCDILNLTFCRLDFHQLLIKIS